LDKGTFAAVLAGIPMAVVIVGSDERITEANPAAQALLGVNLAGRHHGLVLRQPDLLTAIGQVLGGGEASTVRHAILGLSHEVVHRVTVSPVQGGAVCAFYDISEQEQMGLMRRDFVANVSHELRTPLTALLGFIETLRGPAREDTVARDRFLGIMAAEAERMNRLVRDLLHLSRVEGQERVRPTERQDIAGLIWQAVQSLRPMADAGGVAFDVQGADQPVMIPADPDQMTQVLTNLIENAVKYGSSGKHVSVILTREAGLRGPVVRIAVADRGEGIDPVHLPRLTERFYRVDGHRSREKGGTGLGLAIVKHIVNRHRGRMVVDSTPGKGSTFAVILPES
jgi:two-component system phosphate regulon sensor histidine kinase PhoR